MTTSRLWYHSVGLLISFNFLLLPLHALGAWLFAAFILVHVYLTTTSGRRPLDGIKAMITGWEEVRVDPQEKEASS